MAGGVSVPGFQEVMSEPGFGKTVFVGNAGNVQSQFPSRCGFYYLMLNQSSLSSNRFVLLSGVLYEPGLIIPTQDWGVAPADLVYCVVNWNVGGLPYFFGLY